jgi:hypothetical protein
LQNVLDLRVVVSVSLLFAFQCSRSIMTSSRDSLFYTDPRPQRTWNPLDSSSDPDYRYHSPSDSTWPEDVLRDVGLGISGSSGEAIQTTDKRDSTDSTETTTPRDAYKIPQSRQSPPSPHGHVRCPNRATVLQKRLSWVPLTVLILAIYATIFSGLYLAVAFRKPRWTNVSSDGPLVPSTAALLSAFFAKTIELAYVTVCVAFLGQVLSRRALMRDSRGISISDMNMRAWIMQPGSMIVHWEALRYSALTFLGAIALVATFVAMLYTTAAQALGNLFLVYADCVTSANQRQLLRSSPLAALSQKCSRAR